MLDVSSADFCRKSRRYFYSLNVPNSGTNCFSLEASPSSKRQSLDWGYPRASVSSSYLPRDTYLSTFYGLPPPASNFIHRIQSMSDLRTPDPSDQRQTDPLPHCFQDGPSNQNSIEWSSSSTSAPSDEFVNIPLTEQPPDVCISPDLLVLSTVCPGSLEVGSNSSGLLRSSARQVALDRRMPTVEDGLSDTSDSESSLLCPYHNISSASISSPQPRAASVVQESFSHIADLSLKDTLDASETCTFLSPSLMRAINDDIRDIKLSLANSKSLLHTMLPLDQKEVIIECSVDNENLPATENMESTNRNFSRNSPTGKATNDGLCATHSEYENSTKMSLTMDELRKQSNYRYLHAVCAVSQHSQEEIAC